ncbi:MAG: VWA domain-containing protein [Deltaproteobacteria bacterium]|nr:VWA domain-containing protein [Deltaproteobacteria bacterium]
MRTVNKTLFFAVSAWAIVSAVALTMVWKRGPAVAMARPATPAVAIPPPAPVLAPLQLPALPSERIQLALLLDTSSSMSGLIDQAKSQLWRVVNQLGELRHEGRPPELEIALYEYGKSSLAADAGYIRQIVPLSGDLDRVSEELFALTTQGGDEYCGQVIQRAVSDLEWDRSDDVLKLLFIAGNEPFTQGPVDYRQAIEGAQALGITVGTIYCGDTELGVKTGWRDGALLARGRYLSIDHNRRVAHIPAPQDQEIAQLGARLNETYLPYGRAGSASVERQNAQDYNASLSGVGTTVQRSVSKANAMYDNGHWDLVDARRAGVIDWSTIPRELLPPALRDRTVAEREEFLARENRRRVALQQRINELNADREAFVAAKQPESGGPGEATLDQAIIAMVHEHASKEKPVALP